MRDQYTFQILSPSDAVRDNGFKKPVASRSAHTRYLEAVQELRGRVYLADGAIKRSDLDSRGRFVMPGDDESWHLVLVDECDAVIGCARYLLHSEKAKFHDLRLSHSALARDPEWSEIAYCAVDKELKIARKRGVQFVEVGGWALTEEWRNTKAALEIAVGSFALAKLWGGAVGCCTATARHGSASILRRIGGESFSIEGRTIPAYYDDQYGCHMDLLRFDDSSYSRRFERVVDNLVNRFSKVRPIVFREVPHPSFLSHLLAQQVAMGASSKIASRF